MKKIFFSLFAFCLLALPLMAMAWEATDDFGISGTYGLKNNAGVGVNLSSENPINMSVRIINFIIGFLGLAAVVIILIGGFKWMTSMGNQDTVKKAKSLMTAGVIGLVIILAAWGIARYVVMRLSNSIAGI